MVWNTRDKWSDAKRARRFVCFSLQTANLQCLKVASTTLRLMNILKSDVYLTIHLKAADSLPQPHACCVNDLPLCHENTENFWGDFRPLRIRTLWQNSHCTKAWGGVGGISTIVLAGIRQFFASAHVYAHGHLTLKWPCVRSCRCEGGAV